MSSDRQIEANRENAQHSTGPQTEEGKATSSQNARRHGLSAMTIFVPPERDEDFQEMYAAYYREIKPIGELQTDYFEQLIHAKWNLQIARELHVRALVEMDDKKLATAARYIAQFERSFAKAHQALKQEQTDLALRAIPQNEPIAALPLCCGIAKITNEATRVAQQQERTQRPAARMAILTAIAAAFTPPPAPEALNQEDLAA